MSRGEWKFLAFHPLAAILLSTGKAPTIPPCLATSEGREVPLLLPQMSSYSAPFSKLKGGEGTMTSPGGSSGPS